jgi:glycosyltransferase involved in cell wall biosynthesis
VKRKILWVSHTGTWVGPTNSLSLLLEHLAPRFDSAVLLTEDGAFNPLLKERGVPFVSLPSLGKRAIPRMARLIWQGGFDLVYTNNTSGAAANALLAAKLVGKPVICHIRSKWLAPRWWRDRVFRHADEHVAVSRAVADAFCRFVPESRPFVVHNGIPTSDTVLERDAERARLLTELGLPPDSVVALSIAHVMSRKGQIDAVEAMVRAVKEAPDLALLLVGRLDLEPDYMARVRGAIDTAGLADRIRMLGFRRDVDRLCAAADLFVHTAHVDPHPRAVIEGMGAGLPTVAFWADGVGETVLDGDTGFLYELQDTAGLTSGMVRLARDADLRARMGEAARERAHTGFTAAETARRVGDIIDAALRPTTGAERSLDPEPRTAAGL